MSMPAHKMVAAVIEGGLNDDPVGNIRHIANIFSQQSDTVLYEYAAEWAMTHRGENEEFVFNLVESWINGGHQAYLAEHAAIMAQFHKQTRRAQRMDKVKGVAKFPLHIINPIKTKADDLVSRHVFKQSLRQHMTVQGRALREKEGGETS